MLIFTRFVKHSFLLTIVVQSRTKLAIQAIIWGSSCLSRKLWMSREWDTCWSSGLRVRKTGSCQMQFQARKTGSRQIWMDFGLTHYLVWILFLCSCEVIISQLRSTFRLWLLLVRSLILPDTSVAQMQSNVSLNIFHGQFVSLFDIAF